MFYFAIFSLRRGYCRCFSYWLSFPKLFCVFIIVSREYHKKQFWRSVKSSRKNEIIFKKKSSRMLQFSGQMTTGWIITTDHIFSWGGGELGDGGYIFLTGLVQLIVRKACLALNMFTTSKTHPPNCRTTTSKNLIILHNQLIKNTIQAI